MGEARTTADATPRRRARRRRRAASDNDTQADGGPPLLGLQARAGNTAVARLVEGTLQRAPTVEAPVATDRPLLKLGAKGDDVIQLKMELNVAGAEPSVVMGPDFDAQTKAAVIDFQRRHKLEADGDVGPKTWGMLDAIGRDRVSSQDEMDEVRKEMSAADDLETRGDWAGAKDKLLPIYKRPTLVPEVRSAIAWNLGVCEHHLGNFDAASSWYQEYLDSPGIAAMDRRDGDQRLRECRLKQAPGRSESALTGERSDKAVADKPEATDRPLLKEGASGDDVVQLKMELNVAGSDPPLVMGSEFDAKTTAAVLAFQKRHELDPDGQAGPKTWGMLDAIGRDRVSTREDMAEVRAQMSAGDELEKKEDWAGAKAIYLKVYARPEMVPEVRDTVAWSIARCEHKLGNFDAAAGWYQEYLDAPALSTMDRRDGDQRLRECRLKQPPGKSESTLTGERSDQAVADKPEATDRPLLKEGAQGDDVIQLKMELNVAGADPSLVMGRDFDAKTTAAVLDFQRTHGLDQDGDVGPKTWGMLDAIGRDRVSTKEDMTEVRTQMSAADDLENKEDWAGARAIYLKVYARPEMVPEVRDTVAFSLGRCEHHLGNFDAAASWYQEFLEAPGISEMDRRDAVQRLRQCRLKQPPGKSESTLNNEREAALGTGS